MKDLIKITLLFFLLFIPKMKSTSIFTQTKKVSIYFYSKTQDKKYSYLFIKDISEQEPGKYGIVSTDLDVKDNSPLFALSRILTNTFYKLIIEDNLSKVSEGKITDINSLLLPNKKPFPNYQLWDNEVMVYWLERFSQTTIQYDDLPNIKIFFIEFPLLDIEKLNNALKSINYKYSFEYFTHETISNIELEKNSKELIEKLNLEQINTHIKSTEEFLKNNKGDLYIVLACKKAGKGERGFFHFPSLLKGIYCRNTEDWRYMVASKDEFPDEEMLNRAKCILIPGSELSVHNDLEFLRKTEKYLARVITDMEVNNKYPQLKILGICFGLEIIMTAFGGDLNNGVWEKTRRFGPEVIKLQDSFWELDYVKHSGVSKRPSLLLQEAHSEKIIKYPPEDKNFFVTVGSSEFVECEISIDKKGKVFMLQGHPEYSPGLSASRNLPMIMKFSGIKEEDINEESIAKFEYDFLNKEENKNCNSWEWRAICDSFMRYQSNTQEKNNDL